MSSLLSMVRARYIDKGCTGADVRVLEAALGAAGYRVKDDGYFDDETEQAVKGFQLAHGLTPDGVVGEMTAALLDAPHEVLVATAKPAIVMLPETVVPAWRGAMPHDDTASLKAFYGDPSRDNAAWEAANLTNVPIPWAARYEVEHGVWKQVKTIRFHKKVADRLASALDQVWSLYGKDQAAINAAHLDEYSGAYNYRPIRGSSRLSCHAFAAALDIMGGRAPMVYKTSPGYAAAMAAVPAAVVKIFKSTGAYWGGDYTSRKDPMHFQYAHE